MTPAFYFGHFAAAALADAPEGAEVTLSRSPYMPGVTRCVLTYRRIERSFTYGHAVTDAEIAFGVHHLDPEREGRRAAQAVRAAAEMAGAE